MIQLARTYDGSFGSLIIDYEPVAETERSLPIQGVYNTVYVGAVMDMSDCCSIVKEFQGDVDEISLWRPDILRLHATPEPLARDSTVILN